GTTGTTGTAVSARLTRQSSAANPYRQHLVRGNRKASHHLRAARSSATRATRATRATVAADTPCAAGATERLDDDGSLSGDGEAVRPGRGERTGEAAVSPLACHLRIRLPPTRAVTPRLTCSRS